MKLTLDIIAEHLPPSYRPHHYGPKNKKLAYGPPIPYSPGHSMRPETLYITSTSKVQQVLPPGTAVIYIGNRPQQLQSWIGNGAQLLHLEGCSDIFEAYHDILAVYERIDNWDDSLRAELDKTAGEFSLQTLLDLGVALLGHPISITNSILKTICFNNAGIEPNEADRPQNQTNGFMTTHQMELVKEVCTLEREIRTPYLSTLSGVDFDIYCYNLYFSDTFMGCISMNSSLRPFRPGDFYLADHLFKYIKKAYLNHLYRINSSESPTSIALLKTIEHQLLSDRERELFTLESDEYFLCIKLKEKSGIRPLLKEYMCAYVSEFISGQSHLMTYYDEIIGIIRLRTSTANDPAQASDLLSLLGDFVSRMGYCCGISNDFYEITDFPMFIQQANFAIDQGQKSNSDASVFLFQNYRLPYILYECANHLPSSVFINSGLQKLMDEDRNKGTEHIQTLNAYLQAECNALKASEQLFIHRSSLIKRLDKIQRILSMDLSDANTRLYLRICLAILSLN